MTSFQNKIRKNNGLLFALEISPPPISIRDDDVRVSAEKVVEVLGSEINSIEAILLPDLDPYEKEAEGKSLHKEHKKKPTDYANVLQPLLPQNHYLDIVPYHRTHQKLEEEISWLRNTLWKGYNNIVLVGKSSGSAASLTTPTEVAKNVTEQTFREYFQEFNNLLLGSICIPTRGILRWGKEIPEQDSNRELRNMLEKDNAGISFYCTQYIFETDYFKRLLGKYIKECENSGRKGSSIIIGVSPTTGKGNTHFLERLGVYIPSEVKDKIFSSKEGVAKRSIDHVVEMLKGFFDETYKANPSLQLGVYVGVTNLQNIGASVELLGRLREALTS